jgi:hypothetical protein
MMASTFVGIDPGKKGALVALDGSGRTIDAARMPVTAPGAAGELDVARIREWLLWACGNNIQSMRVLLEEPAIRPKESGRSALTIGRNHGRLEGLLAGLGCRFDRVTSRKWRKAMGLPQRPDSEKKLRKAEAVAKCRRLLPDLRLIPDGCRVPQDGLADAGLMAELARRTMGGAE